MTDIEDVLNDPAAGQAVNYAIRGIINPQQAGATLQGPSFVRQASFALPYPQSGPFSRPLGDYGWITPRPRGVGANFRPPGCTTANDFYVAWTANDGADHSEIITRGFSITP